MRVFLALVILAALSVDSHAGEIRKGATVQVRPDSIWFEDAARLTEWQRRKKDDNPAAFASYQEQLLSNREAWQFIKPQTVKILKFSPRDNQVNVEMQTPGGRLSGSKWFVDADALAR